MSKLSFMQKWFIFVTLLCVLLVLRERCFESLTAIGETIYLLCKNLFDNLKV